jgi:hypothetical protein
MTCYKRMQATSIVGHLQDAADAGSLLFAAAAQGRCGFVCGYVANLMPYPAGADVPVTTGCYRGLGFTLPLFETSNSITMSCIACRVCFRTWLPATLGC